MVFLGAGMHFVHHVPFFNHFLGYIFPVRESVMAVMPCIVAAFFSYWVFVHHEIMAIDLVIYVLAISGAVFLANRWRKSSFVRRNWPYWIALAVVVMLLTAFLTYHSPGGILFAVLG